MPPKSCSQPTLGIDASRANAAKRTGTEWYAFHLIQELKAVIPPSTRVVLYSKEPLRDGLENLPPNWESAVLKWPPGKFWTQLRLSWEMLRRPPTALFVPAHTLPLVLPRRSATTLHDVAFMVRKEAYTFAERLYHRFAARFAVRHAAALLTVSEFSKSEIIRFFGAKPEQIAVTPLGYDPKNCRMAESEPEIAAALSRYGIRRPYFLFVGRLEAKKNLSGLLQAFASFIADEPRPGYQLVLVGKRGVGYDAAASEHAELFGKGRVREAGYVCPEDLHFLYSGATALVLPSWYEGFGLPVIEAWACCAPVIASRVASLPEVGGDAVEYCDPAKPESIAEAMRRLAGDNSRRAELIIKGTERLENYSWRRTAELTWETLRPLVGAEKCQ
ncbi:MAG: glycosyltransferase family 1 protein [Patescibacteria group bacterium]|jgi:glycosyltransferase involved in cell wall biosynthesis